MDAIGRPSDPVFWASHRGQVRTPASRIARPLIAPNPNRSKPLDTAFLDLLMGRRSHATQGLAHNLREDDGHLLRLDRSKP